MREGQVRLRLLVLRLIHIIQNAHLEIEDQRERVDIHTFKWEGCRMWGLGYKNGK